MQMPNRTYNTTDYRFGYNGMEKDKEIKGDGNSYTTEFRQYDPRLGRWLSLDPLKDQLSNWSPYVAFNNNPIFYTDPLGLKSTGTGKRSDFDKSTAVEGEPDPNEGSEMFDTPKPVPTHYDDPFNVKLNERIVDYGSGQTMTLPEKVTTDYSDDGKVLKGFSYTFNDNGYTWERNFKGHYDENMKMMLYTHNNSLVGSKEYIHYTSEHYFENENDAYKYMWENTHNSNGTINTEQIAFITEDGVYVSSNAFNENGVSRTTLHATTKDGVLYYNGKRILAEIHTHPNINPFLEGSNDQLSPTDKALSKDLLGGAEIAMAYSGLVTAVVWKVGDTSYTPIVFPANVTRENLMNGTVQLIPLLKSVVK